MKINKLTSAEEFNKKLRQQRLTQRSKEQTREVNMSNRDKQQRGLEEWSD